mmetsp:Transcript_14943/g.24826  ORF Transcript_14943/g.24826 Transcript_14943/m.24826 type:complete len:1185 (+) Transcript_14943:215-3769(+)
MSIRLAITLAVMGSLLQISLGKELPSNIYWRAASGDSGSLVSYSVTSVGEGAKGTKACAIGSLVIVQLRHPVTEATKASVQSAIGTSLGAYIPESTFVVVLARTWNETVLSSIPEIEWFDEMTSDLKVEPSIDRFSLRARVVLVASVLTSNSQDSLEVVKCIAARWRSAIRESQPNATVSVLVDKDRVHLSIPGSLVVFATKWLVLNEPQVLWIESTKEVALMNTAEAGVLQSGSPTGHSIWNRGLTGQGQIVAVQDSGLDYDSCFFNDPNQPISFSASSPNYAHRKVIAYIPADPTNPDYRKDSPATEAGFGHGTHVAGSVGGRIFDGRVEEWGMAYDSKLLVLDVFDDTGAGNSIPADMNMQLSYDVGARIQTNSWGCSQGDTRVGGNTDCQQYDDRCNRIDGFMYTNDEFLVLFAVGNYGSSGSNVGSVVNPSIAKNGLAIGSSDSTASAVAWYSSLGPTIDGRFKPDLLAPGVKVMSAASDGNVGSFNCDLIDKYGTSMSCPLIAGSAALVRQYFEEGWYPSGKKNTPDSFSPAASLVKAALIHSARSVSGVQADSSSGTFSVALGSAPDFYQGFGVPNLDNVLYFADSSPFKLYVESGASLRTLDDAFVCIQVSSSCQNLRATLVYTDYPATVGASKTLVNDLDLQLWSHVQGGTVSYPNNLQGPDRANNAEQITISSPKRGLYTVVVRAHSIPVGGSQRYSLLISGQFFLSTACPAVPASTNTSVSSAAYPSATSTLPANLIVQEVQATDEACSSGSSSSPSMGLIIGIAVGVAVVVIGSAGLVLYIVKRKHSRDQKKVEEAFALMQSPPLKTTYVGTEPNGQNVHIQSAIPSLYDVEQGNHPRSRNASPPHVVVPEPVSVTISRDQWMHAIKEDDDDEDDDRFVEPSVTKSFKQAYVLPPLVLGQSSPESSPSASTKSTKSSNHSPPQANESSSNTSPSASSEDSFLPLGPPVAFAGITHAKHQQSVVPHESAHAPAVQVIDSPPPQTLTGRSTVNNHNNTLDSRLNSLIREELHIAGLISSPSHTPSSVQGPTSPRSSDGALSPRMSVLIRHELSRIDEPRTSLIIREELAHGTDHHGLYTMVGTTTVHDNERTSTNYSNDTNLPPEHNDDHEIHLPYSEAALDNNNSNALNSPRTLSRRASPEPPEPSVVSMTLRPSQNTNIPRMKHSSTIVFET